MIMPHRHSCRDVSREGVEPPTDTLANQHQGLKTHGPGCGMEVDPFEGAMVYGEEDRDGTILQRHPAGRIGAAHLVRTRGHDRALVGPRSRDAQRPARGQKLGLPHEPLDMVSRVTRNMSLVMVTENSLPRLNRR